MLISTLWKSSRWKGKKATPGQQYKEKLENGMGGVTNEQC